MKIGELPSFGHNIADSLSSGICFIIGMYALDVYGEASSSPEGHVVVDFLTGSTSGSPISSHLQNALNLYSEKLPELCAINGVTLTEIAVLSARFGTDPVLGQHFAVTVEAKDGRRSVDQYVGTPGKRFGKARRSKGAA